MGGVSGKEPPGNVRVQELEGQGIRGAPTPPREPLQL